MPIADSPSAAEDGGAAVSAGMETPVKVGILTFHAQLNYGGVLQARALELALKSVLGPGDSVEIVDRRLDDDGAALSGGLSRLESKARVLYLAHLPCALGYLSLLVSVVRTNGWIRRNLALSAWTFHRWEDSEKARLAAGAAAPDVLVVGGDQLWRSIGGADPGVYLLEGAPAMRAFACSVSFGMPGLPPGETERYRRAFTRFSAIGCREMSGVGICRTLGYAAEPTLDPTLLVDRGAWGRLAPRRDGNRDLVCYFLSVDLEDVFGDLEAFARRERCRVRVLLGHPAMMGFPFGLRALAKWARRVWRRLFSPVRVLASAGPQEFLEAFAASARSLGDSYHGLMFSIAFGLEPRILEPCDAMRKSMATRFDEWFALAKGPLGAASVKAALDSFASAEPVEFPAAEIARRREATFAFLRRALGREGA